MSVAISTIFPGNTDDPGVSVDQNLTELTTALGNGAGDTTMKIAVDIFDDDDYAWIDDECVQITTHGTTSTITRAQKSTSRVAHLNTAIVRLWNGTSILTITFDGSKTLTALRGKSRVEAEYGLKIDSVVKYVGSSDPYTKEWFFPIGAQITPDSSDTIDIVVWHGYTSAQRFWGVGIQ